MKTKLLIKIAISIVMIVGVTGGYFIGYYQGFNSSDNTPTPTITASAPTCFLDQIKASDVITATNAQRTANGLKPLVENPKLDASSSAKASDMVTTNYWSHYSPSDVGPYSWFTSAGYQYLYAGENLAIDINTTDQLLSAWMASPGHRANILNPHYTDIGVTVSCGKIGAGSTTLVVAHYGEKS